MAYLFNHASIAQSKQRPGILQWNLILEFKSCVTYVLSFDSQESGFILYANPDSPLRITIQITLGDNT